MKILKINNNYALYLKANKLKPLIDYFSPIRLLKPEVI